MDQGNGTGQAGSAGDALVSGASFAGLTTAFFLHRLGFRVTVVEAAPALRRGGTPVDIDGETIAVLERMGLIAAVRARALPPRTMIFKDEDDRTIGRFAGGHDQGGERFEIHRDDLLDLLAAAVADRAEFLFGRTIAGIENGPDVATVTLDDGTRRPFTLVAGCDGNRSNTRRLAFGEDRDFSHFMTCYGALVVVPRTDLLAPGTTELFSLPGRTAILNGYADRTDIGLGFRTPTEIDYDHRDRAAIARLVHDRFDGIGWKVPAMLAALDGAGDFYFDRITQIRMPDWSAGRVVLVGDAGYCPSPLAGMGGSMAIIGAARLGQALAQHPGDHRAAFRAYRDGLHGFVEEVQAEAAGDSLATMFPADEAELAARNAMVATPR